MAVDKGYGSGYKNTGKAKPVAPRASRARGSAKPNTPLSQMSKAEYNARIVQGQGARRRSNGDFSANALENLTGFNSRDGVDAGDIAGLALAIPAGIGGAVLRAGSRLVPAGLRISRAASRVAKSSKVAAKAGSSKALYLADEAAKLQKKSSDLRTTFYTELYGGRKIALEPSEMGLKDAAFFGGQASNTLRKAKEASDLGARAARRSNPRQAGYEIQLKLAALRKAKEATKKVKKPVKGELQW